MTVQYMVPTDYDVADLDELELVGNPWKLVYPVVDWHDEEEPLDHEHDDGTPCHGTTIVSFPKVLGPCKGPGGHGPAHVWFGPVHICASEGDALDYAQRIIDMLVEERDALHAELADATAANGGETA